MERNDTTSIAGLTVGDRIRLVSMTDDPDPIPAGTMGLVTAIHMHSGWTQLEVSWENGRTLMLVSPPDMFEIVRGDM